MEELSLTDYFAVLRRHKKIFTYVTATIFLLFALFTISWSNYRSTATVEIAQSDIDTSDMAGGETSSIADLRISRIQQKVLSTGSLIKIIKKFDLYGVSKNEARKSKIADIMRKKIKITLIGSKLANPASAQKASAKQLSAIAFNLSFDYNEPLLAQLVTNELVNRFLDEDNKDRRQQTQSTAAFLKKQIKLLEVSLVEQEKEIAEFRTKNGDTRPEAFAFNKQAAASTLMSLQNIESRITTNLGTQGTLRAQLAATSPYSRTMADGQVLTTPAVQLKALESEYATLTAKYSKEHPDVIKIKRQIKALKPLTNISNSSAILQAKIIDAQARLQASEKTNGSEHPDVIKLKKQLAKYKEKRASQPASQNQGFFKEDADNPTYLQFVTQLRAVQEQYSSLTSQRKRLQKEQERYQRAVIDGPVAEQQFLALSRDYDNTLARYRELKEKKLQSDMNKAIEAERSGERLVLTNPAELPLGTQPKRIIFLLAGIILSLVSGLVSVFAMQFLSQSVIGPRHIAGLIGVEPLVCVPHIYTQAEIKRMDRWLPFSKLFTRK